METLLAIVPWPILALLGYIFVISFITYLVFATDKSFAVSGAWRTTERTLLIFTLLGGTLGAIAAMKTFRHKTRKVSFLSKFILIIILQVLIIVGVWYYLGGANQSNFSFLTS
jgi:uncharacterized membrane protein YsdA (DUF1294 family)